MAALDSSGSLLWSKSDMLLTETTATVTLLTIEEVPKDLIDKVEFLRFIIKVDLSLSFFVFRFSLLNECGRTRTVLQRNKSNGGDCRISSMQLIKGEPTPEPQPLSSMPSDSDPEIKYSKRAFAVFGLWLKIAAATPASNTRTITSVTSAESDELKVESSDVTVSSGVRKEMIFADNVSYWESSGSCPHVIQVI
jgi:hypothetical protein